MIERNEEAESNPRASRFECSACDLLLFAKVDEVITHLPFGQLVRRDHVILRQTPDLIEIISPRTGRVAGQNHILDHPLT